jgi:hypothetical protein
MLSETHKPYYTFWKTQTCVRTTNCPNVVPVSQCGNCLLSIVAPLHFRFLFDRTSNAFGHDSRSFSPALRDVSLTAIAAILCLRMFSIEQHMFHLTSTNTPHPLTNVFLS